VLQSQLLAAPDGDYEARLRRYELPGLCPVEEPDGGPLGGPSADELREARSDDLAGETLAEGKRTALVLGSAVHLADDLDGLTRFVVEGEEEDRRIHHAGALLIESSEQLREVLGIRAQRREATRRLESGAQLPVFS